MESGGRGRWMIVAAVVVLWLLPGGTARGQDTCTGCHGDLATSFARTPHGVALQKGEGSCIACHGPGDAHVEAGGGRGNILNPATSPDPHKANTSCASCHENQVAVAEWPGSAHAMANVRCADCHGIHASTPPRRARGKVDTVSDMCVQCHTPQRKNLNQRSTHPLREGKMSCASCHDPHGSTTEHALRADSINDLCYSCHQNMRGPFLWEHSPVREDCLNCHNAHGSNHDKLLVARPLQICQSCHQQGRHQTIAGAPNSIWALNRNCLNCHSQIHGSNHPSGPLFLR